VRILVTGATGFLGTHLVSNLTSFGHEVVALSRKGAAQADHVVPRKGDVLDPGCVKDAAAGCEVVMHCAGKVSRDPAMAEELHRIHVTGTKTVLGACKEAGVRRAVIASSSGTIAVSGDPDHIATETDETPIALINKWPYYRAKLFAERAALSMSSPDFEVVSINPTLLLGPGDRDGSSTTDVRLFLERKIPAVPPGGLSYVDARDAAEAMRLGMEKGKAGERYLIGACNLTIREFFARLERVSGVRSPVLPMPRAPELSRAGALLLERAMGKIGLKLPVDPVSLEMSQYYWYMDSAKAEAVLGWTSRDPMETLADTVNDLRERGVVWPQ
jgi:dihydroflavonol-4-reductase